MKFYQYVASRICFVSLFKVKKNNLLIANFLAIFHNFLVINNFFPRSTFQSFASYWKYKWPKLGL